MKKNMGPIDRLARIAVAIIIGILYLTGVISGVVAIVLLVVAVAFIITGYLSFCPLYYPFGISTFKHLTKKDNN